MQKKVLMTGHNGYIGSVMSAVFLRAGHQVVGLDTGYFSQCTLTPDMAGIPSVQKDIRDLTADDLKDFDVVVHLAALSNDPIGNLNSTWTEDINFQASVRLAELARQAGVERFLFSSSCIMYGMSSNAVVTEDSPLDPKTEYARSKVKSERAIRELANDRFSPVFLRNGTIYGVSPRMRFDTVFNDLMGAAVAIRKVIVYSDGKPFRPVIHVEDVARAFLAAIEAPVADIHNQAFNTGANNLNYRVIELAEIAVDAVPGCTLEVRGESGADQRTYQADFGKFHRTFPNFAFKWTPREGAQELKRAFEQLALTSEEFTDKRFIRLKWLRHLLDSGQLNNDLRWNERGAK